MDKRVDRVVCHPVDMSKRAVIRSSLSYVAENMFLICDPYLKHELTERLRLMMPIVEGKEI